MKKEKKVYSILILFCMAVLLHLLSTPAQAAEGKKDGEKKSRNIVAKVNGDMIYEDQLTPLVEKKLSKFRRHGTRQGDPSMVKRLQQSTLDKLIAQKLLLQESSKLTIQDMEAKVREKRLSLEKRYQSKEHFEKRMKARNLSEKALQESLIQRVYLDEYFRKHGIIEPDVPEEELRTYYENRKSTFHRDEMVKASHILLKVDEKTSAEDKNQALKKAEKVKKDIIAGKDFAEMAREFSDDGNRSEGGDLGYIKKGFMPPEFDNVAFAMGKNEVSDVVETRFGFHIIKVTDKVPEGIAPFNDVEDFIRKYLQEQLGRKKRAAHMGELKKKAAIEIFLNDS